MAYSQKFAPIKISLYMVCACVSAVCGVVILCVFNFLPMILT